MDDFANRVQQIDADGKARYGEAKWSEMMNAIKTQSGGGISPDVMRNVLAQPDPTQLLGAAAKEALLNLSDNGDSQAERTFRAIRQAERDEFRKGRR
jgi:hypothetical protein